VLVLHQADARRDHKRARGSGSVCSADIGDTAIGSAAESTIRTRRSPERTSETSSVSSSQKAITETLAASSVWYTHSRSASATTSHRPGSA